jgi:hypothetical protein
LSTLSPTSPRAFQGSGTGVNAFVTKLNAAGSGLVYSTYLGGTGIDLGHGIAVDGSGAYVTGNTSSSDFPTTPGAFQTTITPATTNAFVTKVNSTGTGLVYSTYLGGSTGDEGFAIAVRSGAGYVTGAAGSSDFPTTVGAFQTAMNGFLPEAFVTKVDSSGMSLDYSTYLGGSDYDQGLGIAVDSSGLAFVTGMTGSSDFPTTPGAFQTARNGFFADAFVTKVNISGSALGYSTYLGGSSDDDNNLIASPIGIAVDGTGSAYVTGVTTSTNFPTQNAIQASNGGLQDAFVTKLTPTGSGLDYSTYLGGTNSDPGSGIAVDSSGNAYVTGYTFSTNFPTKPGSFNTSANGGQDAWVAKIGVAGTTPASISLAPPAAVNDVGTSHTVTATVLDGSGQPVAHVVVRFTVSGSVSASGSCTTGNSGQCSFTYQGPQFPGADMINAFADTNNNGVQDSGEPAATATKAWVFPTSTTTGQVTGGGHVLSPTATDVAFGFNAKSDDKGVKGECTVVDPSGNVMVKCTDATTLVVNGNTATIFGNATVNGMATTYRIDVTDNGEPGSTDSFMIQTTSGYVAGGVLVSGNIQIHK